MIIKNAIDEISKVYTRSDEIFKKVELFQQLIEKVYNRNKETFKQEIIKAFGFDPEERSSHTQLYCFIRRTLNRINENDKETRISGDNFRKYLRDGFSIEFQNYLHEIIKEIFAKINQETNLKLQKYSHILGYRRTENGFEGSTFVSFKSYETHSLAESVVMGGVLGGISVLLAPITLGASAAIAGIVSGINYFGWKRESIIEELTKFIYNDLTQNYGLKNNLVSAGCDIFHRQKNEIQSSASMIFQPKEDYIPGCPFYQTLCEIRDEMEKLINENF